MSERAVLLTLIAAAFLCAVAWGFGVHLGQWLWRRTLLVDRRWTVRREERRRMRAAMMAMRDWTPFYRESDSSAVITREARDSCCCAEPEFDDRASCRECRGAGGWPCPACRC